MTVSTTGAQVVKLPQYVEESAYGTMPTSPAFNWIGLESQIDTNSDIGAQEINSVGYEDVQAVLIGKQEDLLKLTFAVQSSTFLKYAINSVNWTTPTGTIGASLSILWSILLNGTENFMTANGCRPNSLKLTGQAGQKLQAEMEVWAKIVNPATTSGPTTPTYATNPATAPWNFTDEGTTPVTFAGTNLDTTEIEVDFNRNLKRVHTLQSQTNLYMPPTKRAISGTITVVWENSTLMTDLQALTGGSLVWTLKNATSVLTLTNCYMTKLSSLSVSPDDVVYEKYAIAAESASVT
ncbi:MAG: phage tail tube protein [Nitrososphaerales archaeon]